MLRDDGKLDEKRCGEDRFLAENRIRNGLMRERVREREGEGDRGRGGDER